MVLLSDESNMIAIELKTWNGTGYNPDTAAEFFNVGCLPRDEIGAYIVPDVDYCIEYAQDWQDGRGDFAEDTGTENRKAIVYETITSACLV